MRYRVGELRPSQILFSFGIGANVDLPNFSVIVMGLDHWHLERAEEIPEARLLKAVQRRLGWQVQHLYAPPAVPSDQIRSPQDEAARIGIPVGVFPRWLRCPRCDVIASVDSGLFELKDPFRSDLTRYVHINCSKMVGNKPPAVVPVRFIVACENGHMDDFPWVGYVHRGNTQCNGNLRLIQFGMSDAITDVMVRCENCKQTRPMAEAFSREARHILPKCQGHHPHLGVNHRSGCLHEDPLTGERQPTPMTTLLLGASNSWFAILLSVLSVPEGAKNRLAQLVDNHWSLLQVVTSREILNAFRQAGQLHAFAEIADDDLWSAIQARLTASQDNEDNEEDDLKRPEWLAFIHPLPSHNNDDFQLDPVAVPSGYEAYFQQVVLASRLREVRALIGFTRIESPGEFGEEWDVPKVRQAPLAHGHAGWVPTAEVRGEGIFIQFQEAAIAAWCQQTIVRQREQEFRDAHWQWRHVRGLTPESEHFPGIRYILLHSFAHALMRQLSLECGYTSASIRERIYAREPVEEGGPMAGVLLYTAAADSEGTLGGLVTQGRPSLLARHLGQALQQMELCTSDPLCADHHPHHERKSLHGAACHACQFAPETSCERGNKYLDRTLLMVTLHADSQPFFQPNATDVSSQAVATAESEVMLPAFLTETTDGVPLYRLDDLAQGWEQARVPRQVDVEAPAGTFIVQLEAPTLEAYKVDDAINLLAPGRWVLFRRTEPDDFDRDSIQLLRHRTAPFKATGKPWTIGRPDSLIRKNQPPLLTIRYASTRQQCRPEKVPLADIESLGRLVKVYSPDLGDWTTV